MTMNSIFGSAKVLMWMIVVFHKILKVEASEGTVVKINATENHTITLPCNHDRDESGINAIVWEDKNEQTVAELSYQSNGKLNNVRNEMDGRVTISFPEGDLILSDVSRVDGGYYKCVVIHRGYRHDPKKWQLLNVLVPPEKLQIKCSGTTTGTPDEDCSIIKKDQIKAIQCEVVSNPVSNLVWSDKSTGCSPKAFGGTVKVEYGLSQKEYGLRPVCQGRYCCQAHYEVDGVLLADSVCVNIGDVGHAGTTADSLTDKENVWKFIIIVIVAIALVTIVIFITCICFCICYRRRNRKYPCGLKRLPCFHLCFGKNGKKHHLNINVVKIHDNGVDNNTALTPFLGPNHVAQTRDNVFTFVVNEAQDNPQVNRVKVTQDNDPTGDKSRTVEIYKTRENSALLPQEEQNVHVQPGLFRRALSNSDVSKIVYTETIDDVGRVKREIDIIKGYPAEEKEEVVDDYLQSAGGVSLSPTGAAYSMNSMQRKRSKLPTVASETDVRRPVLQRQLTIERSRENSRNLVYQHSQSIEFDNLPTPSIDLDEVD